MQPVVIHQYKPGLYQFTLIGLLLVSLTLVGRLYSPHFFLPEFHFYNSSIFFSILETALLQYPMVTTATLLLSVTAGLAMFLLCRWNNVASSEVRVFILIVAATLVFEYATYEYNYIYEQSHTVDRLALIAILVLSFWRPIFVFLLPLAVFCLQSQFATEFSTYSLALTAIPIKLIFAFCVCTTFSLVTKRQYNQTFAWISVVIIMAHYWAPGYAKLAIDWFQHGQIYNMTAASYAGGWLQFINKGEVEVFLRTLAKFDLALMAITLLFETIVIFALCNRKLLLPLLFFAIVFHIAVFVQSGIAAWQWIVIDAAFIYLLIKMHGKSQLSPIPKSYLMVAFSCIVIASSYFWSGAAKLAWHDVPIHHNYYVDVIDGNDKITRLTPAYFSPYEYGFTLGGFNFLSKKPILPISWGTAKNLNMAQLLSQARSIEEIEKIHSEYAISQYNHEKALIFKEFVATYLIRKQTIAENTHWFDYIRTPLNFYTGKQNRNPIDSDIRSINISLKTTWFNGDEIIVLSDEVVAAVNPLK